MVSVAAAPAHLVPMADTSQDPDLACRALVDDAWLDSKDVTTADVARMADALAMALGDASQSAAIFSALVDDAWVGTEILMIEDLEAIAEVAVGVVRGEG